jgi:hypothetical protein
MLSIFGYCFVDNFQFNLVVMFVFFVNNSFSNKQDLNKATRFIIISFSYTLHRVIAPTLSTEVSISVGAIILPASFARQGNLYKDVMMARRS